MRRFTCLAMLVALATAPLAAQFSYVPSDTPTTGGSNSFPFNFSSTTGRFQNFLDATYLPGAPVKITEIAFSRSGTQATSFQTTDVFQMRMSHTSISGTPNVNFADNMAPCPTNLLHVNTFTWTSTTMNAWEDIGTVCDFGYDGKSHVCLEIRYRGQLTSLGFSCRSDAIPRAWANSTTADNYDAVASSSRSASSGLKCRLTWVKDHICLVPDTTSIGSSSAVSLVNFNPGDNFQVAASLGQTPFTVGAFSVCLDVDGVFLTSVFVGPPVFGGYAGSVPAAGSTAAKFAPPAVKALVGLCVYHAAVAYDKSGLTGATNTAGTQLVP